MLRLLLLSTFLLCSATFLRAQMANDTLTPAQLQAEFLTELEDLMTNGKSKEVEAAYESFAGIFASGAFTPEEQSAITNTGLLMRGRKLGATPYFKDYLRTVVKIKEKTEVREARSRGLRPDLQRRRLGHVLRQEERPQPEP